MWRIMGALLLAGSGIGGASWLCRRASASLLQVEGFLTLIRQARLQVECFCMPVSQILSRCEPDLLRRCGYGGNDAPEDFAALWRNSRIHDPATARILWDFGNAFGRGYREEQTKSCEYCLSLLEERRQVLSEQLPIQRKLYSTLCVSGALALMILFL